MQQPVDRAGTVLETDEDVRQALLSIHKGGQRARPTAPEVQATTPAAFSQSVGRAAVAFRPTIRPPVALLTVCDDGKTTGEVIRIREHRFIIGRTDGDLRIPIDGRISSRHVEITHQVVGGMHRWVVTDLQSTHGLFVRVSKTALVDQAEFLVGGGRYRFDAMQIDPAATTGFGPAGSASDETGGWSEGASPIRPPALTELLGSEIGNRVLLVKPEYWIGSDSGCTICRPDDPFCEPQHVKVYRKSKGAWHAEHNKTTNGLWLRMAQVTVEARVQFQIGEQRFELKLN